MIIQLLPDQVATLWSYIKFAFEESMPPYVNKEDYDSNKVLASLLSGKAQCWIVYEQLDNEKRFESVVITQVLHDRESDHKNLLIYSLYGDNISEKNWRHGLVALAKWGVERGCKAIVAYTDNKVIINKVLQFGGFTSTFVSIPLETK
jgi:hypothetical protein